MVASFHVLGDLDGEFAGGNHDQGFDTLVGVQAEALNQWKAKTKSLAGSCLGLANDVLSGQGNGDGLFLNRERFDDAFASKRLDQVGFDTEVGKIHV